MFRVTSSLLGAPPSCGVLESSMEFQLPTLGTKGPNQKCGSPTHQFEEFPRIPLDSTEFSDTLLDIYNWNMQTTSRPCRSQKGLDFVGRLASHGSDAYIDEHSPEALYL